MDVRSRLTILFDPPFWIGLYAREEAGQYEVCKIPFGAEPSDAEVYEFLLRHRYALRFSPRLEGDPAVERSLHPKRLQRKIRAELQNKGIGTKAQQALQLQREQSKRAKKIRTREQREAEIQRRFTLRREKKKARHRGR